ncbi:MAG TPA: HDOD domain-containing protein [Macromonas sp.]|nr:HDOD domain-containing protein [Macromonas sp.]
MAFNILEHVAFAYQPIWGQNRQLAGVRLRVRALHTESVDAAHLLHVLGNEWSERAPFLLVSFADQPQLLQALSVNPHDAIWLELPDAGDYTAPAMVDAIALARRMGHRLVQQVPLERARALLNHGNGHWRLLLNLWPEQVAQALQASEQRGKPQATPSPVLPGQLYQHIGTRALAVHCLDDAKAWGLCGWPDADVLQAYRHHGVPVDKRTLVRVQQALMRDVSMETLEDLIHQDPVLTFRMLRLVNSPIFGTTRQVETVRQALMLLGQTRLRDWLLELMPGACTDQDMWPVRQGMVLRGRLMTYLMDAGVQQHLNTESYLTGLFSRMHQLMHEPMGVVLGRVPLPEAIASALLHGNGPYHPYLEIARGMEDMQQLEHLPALCEQAGFPLDHVNRALIRMLAHWHNVL